MPICLLYAHSLFISNIISTLIQQSQMEAFARSSTTWFAKANTNRPPSPLKALLGRSSISLVRFGISNANVHPPITLRLTAIRSVASSETRVLRNPDSAGLRIEPAAPSKTVHVQFQLHKNCRYGDNFLLVGNEPIIGQWNPFNAIPLNWSDGDIWTADLDIPIDRAIQFKFILKQSTGDLLWQPGPDRILHTWDTNCITIAEDWKNAKLQKLTENQFGSQNVTLHASQAVTYSEKLASANGIPIYGNNNKFAFEDRGFRSEKGTMPQESQAVCFADDGVCVMTRPPSLGSLEDLDDFCEIEYYDDEYYEDHCEYEDRYEDEDVMFTYEEGRVLVPGLVQGVAGKTIDISTDDSPGLVHRATEKKNLYHY